MEAHTLLIVGGTPRSTRTNKSEWTVREYARIENVHERTVRRWIDKGAVNVRRTPGGGIRITGTR